MKINAITRPAMALWLLAAAIGASMTASAQETCPTTERTELLAAYPAVRAFYDTYNTGDASLIDCALDAGWVTNPRNPAQSVGPAGMRETIAGVAASFASLTFDIRDVVVAGDRIVVRSDLTVLQSGSFLGVDPSAEPLTIMNIDIHRVGSDGRIVETWHVEDWLSYLLQRGILPLG
ncbi:MAG: ester cyclase [Bauldia sp.]|nr:ester cyclase [Bauldia sp.]